MRQGGVAPFAGPVKTVATPGTAADVAVRGKTSARFIRCRRRMPIHGPSRQSAAQPLRRWARMLAGALLVVAGLILIADPDLG